MHKQQETLSYWKERFGKNGIFSAGYTDALIHRFDDKVRWKIFLKEAALKQGDKILDVGCNYGPWSIRLANKKMIVTGIDIIEKAIEVAKMNAAKASLSITFENVSVENSSFEDQEFDKIISITVLQHIISDSTFSEALVNISRQLNDNGKLIMIESASEHKIEEKLSYKRERTLDEQIKLCEQSGLKLIKLKGIFNFSVKWYYGIQKLSFPKKIEIFLQYSGILILNPLDYFFSRFETLSTLSNLKLMIFKKINEKNTCNRC